MGRRGRRRVRVRVAKRVESDGVHNIGDYGDLVLWRYFAEIGWFASIVRMVVSVDSTPALI